MSRLLGSMAGSILLMLCLMAAMPDPASAATLHDSDYVTLAVPDIAKAKAFFGEVLDCEPLSGEQASENRAVLLCATGNVVELTATRVYGGAGEPLIQLPARDVAHADQWLRREGVTVTGSPSIIHGAGAQPDTTIVNFVTPWGPRLQLIERDSDSGNTAVR
jgi:catechol 2,3-dioxygenase-like lactoylglutathione lyase family enzyme